ncbi:hypothetical protein [Jatrophihabitans endophyticus]|uniref:hypothetical protein n=1 Tax=Jatrophihabitans endophyticus TaxID=1206085 RepID=UPI0019FA71DD|nr:hypothetical protein [Jatrophihabitans endophyticus]MBE7189411.1 hypothetical protein [Jatrophihabitans endophyticus]
MNKTWAGITAGLLAGAAGATAKNIVSYLDQTATGDAPPSSPSGPTVTNTASTASVVAAETEDRSRAGAAGPLGGLLIGLGVGAVAGVARGTNATPNPAVAAVVTGLAAMAVGDGAAAAGGQAATFTPARLGRDLIAHLAYGGVTAYALHRMLDPHTPSVARLNPFS